MSKEIGTKRLLMEKWYCVNCDEEVEVLYETSQFQEGELTEYMCYPEHHHLKFKLDKSKKQLPRR